MNNDKMEETMVEEELVETSGRYDWGDEETEDECEHNGLFGAAILIGLGSALGYGISKAVPFVKKKASNWKQKRKAKNNKTENVDDEFVTINDDED